MTLSNATEPTTRSWADSEESDAILSTISRNYITMKAGSSYNQTSEKNDD
jgi:hypothetical protein